VSGEHRRWFAYQLVIDYRQPGAILGGRVHSEIQLNRSMWLA
jgi:hypothetical protein